MTVYQVPDILVDLLKKHPKDVKKWMVESLGMTDLHRGIPPVRIVSAVGVPSSTTVPAYLCDSFQDNRWSDLTVTVDGNPIYLHKVVIAPQCSVLEAQWASSMDSTMTLQETFFDSFNTNLSHSTACMFFKYFYTFKVNWPQGSPDPQSALELLCLASFYHMEHLLSVAEVALKGFVTLDNCCHMLQRAAYVRADQLKEFCLYYAANGYKMVKATEGYRQLDAVTAKEVDMAVQKLRCAAQPQ